MSKDTMGTIMKKILIVDDEENIRLLYKEELEEAGYRVAVAEDAAKALERAESWNPDLIMLDIKMPGIEGIEVARRLKARRRDLPIVFCTAYEDYKHEFGAWSSDAYIVKSSNLSELKARIRELLGE
jgi:DNA-binding response OmpR family regulator